MPLFNQLQATFSGAYAGIDNAFLERRLDILRAAREPNARTRAAAEIWAPELQSAGRSR